MNDTIQLPEVLIYKGKMDPDARQFYCYKETYPYAKLASERLSTRKQETKKKRFLENYLSNEFEVKKALVNKVKYW
jgi:hypothetical protein